MRNVVLLVVVLASVAVGSQNYLFFGSKNDTGVFPLEAHVHDGHLEEVEEIHEEALALQKGEDEDHYVLRVRSVGDLHFEDHHEEEGNHTEHGHGHEHDEDEDEKKKKKRQKKKGRRRLRLSQKNEDDEDGEHGHGHEGEEEGEHHGEYEAPHGHVHLRLVYKSPGLEISGFGTKDEVEVPGDFEFEMEEGAQQPFVASFQLVVEEEEGDEDHDHDDDHDRRRQKRSLHRRNEMVSEIFNITSATEVEQIVDPTWLASAIAVERMALAGFQTMFTSHFGTEYIETTGCPTAADLFAEYDSNADGNLDLAEMVPATATVTNMLLRGCHLRRAVVVASGPCTPLTPSTESERWGYTFLSLILISLPGLFGALLVPLSSSTMETLVFNVGIAVAMGGLFGAFIFEIIPYFSRTLATFSVHGLDGPTSVTTIEADYIFPFVISMVAVMIAFAAERYLHHWHRNPKSSVNHAAPNIKVMSHNDLEQWEELKGMGEAVDSSSVEAEAESNPWKLLHVAVFLTVPMVALISLSWGLLVGAAWTVAPRVGLMVSVWVFVTQLFVLVASTVVMVAGKVAVKNAILSIFVPALCFHLLGGIIGVAVGPTATAAARYLVALSGGLVVYIGISQIGPWMVRQIGHKRVLGQSVIILAAFIALFCLGYFLALPICA